MMPRTPQLLSTADIAAALMARVAKANYGRATAGIAVSWPPHTYREHLIVLTMTVTRYYCEHREVAMSEEVCSRLTSMYHCVNDGGPHRQMLGEAVDAFWCVPELVADLSVRRALSAARSVL